jgi:hypothetical protein
VTSTFMENWSLLATMKFGITLHYDALWLTKQSWKPPTCVLQHVIVFHGSNKRLRVHRFRN